VFVAPQKIVPRPGCGQVETMEYRSARAAGSSRNFSAISSSLSPVTSAL